MIFINFKGKFLAQSIHFTREVELQIKQNQLLISDDKGPLLTATLDHNLRAESLLENPHSPGEPFPPLSKIRIIDQNNCQLFLSKLSSSSGDDLLKLREELALRINFQGFHTHFTPVRKLGKGSFASVHLVQRLEDNKQFAVKAFSKKAVFAQKEDKQSLLNQIEILRKINHKNISRLYGVFQSQNSIYLCMEFIRGPSLKSLLKSQLQLPFHFIQNMFRELLKALQVLHYLQIAHRDIKPQNIIFMDKQATHPVLVDFGLSTLVNKEKYLFFRCGTPGYVSPQIVSNTDPHARLTTSCDIFSMGIIFYMVSTRKSVFSGKDTAEILKNNRSLKMQLRFKEIPNFPPSLINLIEAMLIIQPAKRPTPRQLLDHPFFQENLLFTFCKVQPQKFQERQSSKTMKFANKEDKPQEKINLNATRLL